MSGKSDDADDQGDARLLRLFAGEPMQMLSCTICGDSLAHISRADDCPKCGTPARARSLRPLLDRIIRPFSTRNNVGRPLLAFAAAEAERKLLATAFDNLKSVSLFGEYGSNHESGVDVRDLSRFPDASFSGVYSILLFDYFAEHELALAEAFRVLAPGGILFTLILSGRLVDGDSPPVVTKYLEKGKGYFDYVPAEAKIPSIRVGRNWLLVEMRRAGFIAEHAVVEDKPSGTRCEWFIGVKPQPAAAPAAKVFTLPPRKPMVDDAEAAKREGRLQVISCPICGDPLSALVREEHCATCGSPARGRSLKPILDSVIAPHMQRRATKSLLAFAANGDERKMLAPVFSTVKSVSLYGSYGEGHEEGIDIRDLSKFADRQFDGVFGIRIFDYFVEHEQALAEAFRVLADGGVMFTEVADGRLMDGDSPPVVAKYLAKTKGYFDYVPVETQIPSIRVGRDWLLAAMKRAGFVAERTVVEEVPTGKRSEWFIGFKPVKLPDVAVASASSVKDRYSGLALQLDHCSVCGDSLEILKEGERCPKCEAPARTRSLKPVLDMVVNPLRQEFLVDGPLLGFSIDSRERTLLDPHFPEITSVSLYDAFGKDHAVGVDIRDLSRFASGSFGAVFGVLIFDYFVEHETALQECWRVLADGGLFITQILPGRLEAGSAAPSLNKYVSSPAGYRALFPEAPGLPSVKVGIDWFLEAMRRTGFDAAHVVVVDQPSGISCHWFIGRKGGTHNPLQTSGEAKQQAEFPAPGIVVTRAALSETHSTPVDPAYGFRRITVTLSVPDLPEVARSVTFAEHAYDRRLRQSTDQVVGLAVGGILASSDLGRSWDYIATPETGPDRLRNCHTTEEGIHLVQSMGAVSIAEAERMQGYQPPLYRYDAGWRLIDQMKIGSSHWHGSRAIDEKDGTIIFAEYPDNGASYRSDFKSREAEFRHLVCPACVFRSTNGGRDWEKVFEVSYNDIRHFHVVMADPFVPHNWWLTSGDRPNQSRIWRSTDDGRTWVDVTNPQPAIALHPSSEHRLQVIHRLTDLVIEPDRLIWATDDLLGDIPAWADPAVPLGRQVGSRLIVSPKTMPLQPVSTAVLGSSIRSLVDLGPAILAISEAKHVRTGLNPTVHLISKTEPDLATELFNISNFGDRPLSMTASLASRTPKDGRFFSCRDALAVFPTGPRILIWDVELS